MMRKVFLFFGAFQILYTRAQNTKLFINLGFTVAGLSSQNIENFYEVNSIVSFNTGVLATVRINNKITLQPSLLVCGKGAKTKGGEPPYNTQHFSATTNPYYLELPINIVFNVPIKRNHTFFIGGGFYGAIGVGGKNKIDYYSAGTGQIADKKKINFKDDGYGDIHNYAGIGFMKRGDYGLCLTSGLIFHKFLVSLDYKYGLMNIDRGTRTNSDENKNRVLSLSVGWRIL